MRTGLDFPRLPASLAAWGSPGFADTLKDELASLPAGSLPLEAGCDQGGRVDDGSARFTVLLARADAQGVQVRLGVFFTEVVGGCSCGEDPFSVDTYCELDLAIQAGDARLRAWVVPAGGDT